MKMQFTILTLVFCSFCNVTFGQNESETKDTDVFPTLVRDALLNFTFFGPKQHWICGVEHAVKPVKQYYVVMVPGSEGFPGRYERRERDVPTHFPIPHRYDVDEIVITNVAGKQLDLKSAQKSIEKFRSFLFVPTGKSVSKLNRTIFNDEMVIVTPKQK